MKLSKSDGQLNIDKYRVTAHMYDIKESGYYVEILAKISRYGVK